MELWRASLMVILFLLLFVGCNKPKSETVAEQLERATASPAQPPPPARIQLSGEQADCYPVCAQVLRDVKTGQEWLLVRDERHGRIALTEIKQEAHKETE